LFAVIAVLAAHTAAMEPELGRPFVLKPAESAVVEGLRITFEGVAADSRCPRGATCAWAGDAAAAFVLEKAPAAALRRTLHTSGRFERQTDCEGLVVRLEEIAPYPTEGASIAAGDYRATVLVTKK
jgi:hypothetical protein